MGEKGELAQRLIEAMRGGVSGTTSELAVWAQADVRSVRMILRLWLEADIVHISEVVAPRRTLVYSYGHAAPGAVAVASVARPPRARQIVEVPPERWPQLDPDLAAAVDAMVRVRLCEQ